MEHALAHAYKGHELAVVAALKTVYYMAKKNLPNYHFSDMKQFLVIQGCKEIDNLSFQCSSGGRQYTYEHSENVKGLKALLLQLLKRS